MKLAIKIPAALTVLFALAPLPALAWGSSGHRMIGEVAIRSLPADLPAFIRSPTVIWQTGELAREPDRSRGSGNPHDNDRDPGHFLDVADDLTIGGVVPLNVLPRTREDYDTALRAKGTDQYKMGFLPYQIIDGWQQLVKDFAYWRADNAGEKFAANAAERAWFVNDRALREQLTIRDLGTWSHFVGDGSQPMHASVHYDGWGNFPNPQGYPSAPGFHARFEGAYVHDNVTENDIAKAMPPVQPLTGSIQDRVSRYLIATQKNVEPVYRLEKNHAFDVGNLAGKPFTVERLAAGASELRDLIVAAWNASANATVGYPGMPVGTLEQGYTAIYPYLYGTD